MGIDIRSKWYITKKAGGINPCIEGNNKYKLRPFSGSVLPNCIGFATGYLNELLGLNSCKFLGNYKYAEGIKEGAKNSDCQITTKPIKGKYQAILWGSGDKYHIAVVTEVISDTKVKITESGWNYKVKPIIREKTITKGSGNWGNKTKKFNCFIVPPQDPKFIIYVVKKGDTLLRIAAKYKTTVKQIASDNNIKNINLIVVGQKLKIREE